MKNLLLIVIVLLTLNLIGGLRGNQRFVEIPKEDVPESVPLCKCGESCQCCDDEIIRKRK